MVLQAGMSKLEDLPDFLFQPFPVFPLAFSFWTTDIYKFKYYQLEIDQHTDN